MSALGQKRTFSEVCAMSALLLQADITELAGQFRPMMGSAGFDAKSGIVNSRTSPRGGRKGTFFFATRTMYCTRTGENQPGSITVLITWMTPLDCITLLMVISAVSPLAS